jgi:hypothetical protein
MQLFSFANTPREKKLASLLERMTSFQMRESITTFS